MSHTPTPWKRVDRHKRGYSIEVEGANGSPVLTSRDYEGQHIDDEDMDHAIACVNACADKANPAGSCQHLVGPEKATKHDTLIDVISSKNVVVRWCPECGGIVTDLRLSSGQLMPGVMKVPELVVRERGYR